MTTLRPEDGRDAQAEAMDAQAVAEQARAWAVRLRTGAPTAGDVKAFRLWRARSAAHAAAWSRVAQDWRVLGDAARALHDTHPEKLARPPRRRDRRLFLGAAVSAFGTLAAVAVVRPPWGLWPSWSELGADYRTATGEQRDIQLRERVRITLNTQTSISVRDGGDALRIGLIAGEAALSAAGSACEVSAGGARMQFSDADIDVRSLADGQVRLRCNAGRVRLLHPQGPMDLGAGQQVVYDARQRGAALVARADDEHWRQGIVVFDDLPLSDAIDEINRYRPGHVSLMNDSLANRRFSGRFAVSALDDAIALLQSTYGLRVRRVGDLVLLT